MGVSEMDDEFLNRPVKVEEVWEALSRVREEATPGEDGVMGKWLKFEQLVGLFLSCAMLVLKGERFQLYGERV